MALTLLDASATLLERRPRSATFRRRAVSTAYYALFHALAKSCTAALLPSAKPDAQEYQRLYRALEHGNAFAAFRDGPLGKERDLKGVADIFTTLKVQRERADYLPPDPNLFRVEEVRELIAQAREAINALEGLGIEMRRFLASFLLVKGSRR